MAKSIGQRVMDPESGRQGVVISTEFDGTPSRQECLVKWDEGMLRSQPTWEMGEDLRIIPNIPGDAFKSMANGFGVRVGELSPINVNAAQRERKADMTASMITFLQAAGVKVHVSLSRVVSRDRQLTLDIRSRVNHGAPVKGGSFGKPSDPRRVALSKAAATGEPMLVRKGPLQQPSSDPPFRTPLGWAARAIKLSGKANTRTIKRRIKARRKPK